MTSRRHGFSNLGALRPLRAKHASYASRQLSSCSSSTLSDAIRVAEGIAEAAGIHMRSLVARLRVVDRELREAERNLISPAPLSARAARRREIAFNGRTL